MQTLKRFFASRYDLNGDVFSSAVNEISIVFSYSKLVMKALANFHKSITTGSTHAEDELVKLIKIMCKDVGD